MADYFCPTVVIRLSQMNVWLQWKNGDLLTFSNTTKVQTDCTSTLQKTHFNS